MKTKTLGLLLCFVGGLLVVSCGEQTPKVKPLAIDLPASYKSDTAAYRFIMKQVEVWNTFGKEVEKMYRQGEKWKKREFNSLSERELYNLVKLDFDYAALWVIQDHLIDNLMLEAESAMRSASEQGQAKIIETQKVAVDYYALLIKTFGKDLKLDQDPYVLTPDDILNHEQLDSGRKAETDSILHLREIQKHKAEIDSILQIPTPPGPK